MQDEVGLALNVNETYLSPTPFDPKPDNEQWAVLVNEFGEISIDGAMLAGHYSDTQSPEEKGVFIREVLGGCMCCTTGITNAGRANSAYQTS